MGVVAAGRKLGLALILMMGVCLLWGSAPYLPRTQIPGRLLHQAKAAYEAGDYPAASETAQVALTLWQKPPRADFPAIVETLVLLGNIFMESGDPDGAFQQYSVAYTFGMTQCGPLHPATADALNGMGEYYYRKTALTAAEDYFRSALDIRRQTFGTQHEKVAASLNNIGNCLASGGRYPEAIEIHQTALELRRTLLPADHADIAVSLSNLGNCRYLSGDPSGALGYFEQALTVRQKIFGAEHPKTAALYNSMGNCFDALQQPENALRHYETALQYNRKALGNEHPVTASILENIADLHFDRGDYLMALDHFRQARNLQARVYGESSPQALTLEHKIGLCHQYKGEYETALEKHQSALAVLVETFGSDHPLIGALHNNIGNCRAGLKNYPEAIEHYRKAFLIFQSASPIQHAQMATTLNNLGAALMQAGDAPRALEAFGAAARIIAPGDHAALALAFKNRAAAAMQLQRYGLAEILADSARLLLPLCPPSIQTELRLAEGLLRFQRARQTSDYKLMEQAANTLDTALQHTSVSLVQLAGAEAREHAMAQQLPALRCAVLAYFLLFEHTQNSKYLSRAFALSEADKNLQWGEISRRELLGRQTGIPDSIRLRERAWSDEINRLEKERLLLGDPAQIQGHDLQLAALRDQLRTWMMQIARMYPDYPGLAFSIAVPTVAELQRELPAGDQAFIKYFDADSLWLVFVITQSEATGLLLPKSSGFNQRITAFRRCLQDYIGAPLRVADSLAIQYTEHASALYAELVAPIENTSAAAAMRWILAPDGAAAYLPFEALLYEKPAEPSLFRSHAYLLKKYRIAYAHSAAHWLLLEQAIRVRTQKNMVAFAPDFSDHPAGLPPLRYNTAEARAAVALMHGRLYSGKEADAATFLRESGKYSILLPATHGRAGRTIGEMSYLAFGYTPGDTAAPVVYARDLYALHIPAELVVLSACETSVGEYRAGQGVISLAKGFFQAGARSVVATLWSVDDARHADLMIRFFENLKKKQSKDEALQQAKLDYIQTYPHDEAHPAYWAGSTAWGNMRPLQTPALKYLYIGIALTLTLLIAGGAWIVFGRRK